MCFAIEIFVCLLAGAASGDMGVLCSIQYETVFPLKQI